MKLELLPENDPSLRVKSDEWDFEKDGSPLELASEMIALMKKSRGIGLAAPQCGIKKRIFILTENNIPIVCVNPSITSSGTEEVLFEEGCLSFPGLKLLVARPDKIMVEFYNIIGQKIRKEYTGLESRIFQHELDHLNGVCFDSRVGQLKLSFAKKKRKKLA